MSEETSVNRGGRPRKTHEPITFELLCTHHKWLDELVAGGFHNTTKEGLLIEWIVERLRQLRDAGEIRSTLLAESKIVAMNEASDSQKKNSLQNVEQSNGGNV